MPQELDALGCTCGRQRLLPAGRASWHGDEAGDDYAIKDFVTIIGWQARVRGNTFYVRCGQCEQRWPWERGGNARDRRRALRAFALHKARPEATA